MGATPIRAVLFDLWGTLIIDEPDVGAQRAQYRRDEMAVALDGLGLHRGEDEIEAACLAAASDLERLHATGLDVSARARTILHLRHIDEALPDRLDDAGWRRLDAAVLTPALAYPPPPMPGAAGALAAVKALGLSAGLISNAGLTPGFVLRQVLDSYGLLQHFDALIFSDEAELSKPNAAIFRHALDEMGIDAAEAAFVGDQPLLDVHGAQQAGLWSVQIGDAAPGASGEGADPHARIDALDGLVPALRALGLV